MSKNITKDSLGNRMKGYEAVSNYKLTPGMPYIIRLDGKAFHTFTRGFEKPFDDVLMLSMQATMKKVCEAVQGCRIGYTQSDEITVIIIDNPEATPYFDGRIQKIASITAATATAEFTKVFRKNIDDFCMKSDMSIEGNRKRYSAYEKALASMPLFDSRVFNVPLDDITNNLWWRQADAERNSVQMVGRAYFSEKQMFKKNAREIMTMLETEKGIVWDNLPTPYKRGTCCIKVPDENGRYKWVVDRDIPRFLNEGREYVESRLTNNTVEKEEM